MRKSKILSMLTMTFTMLLASCGGTKTYDLTFHQTEPGENEDVTVEIIPGVTTQIDVWQLEPDINEKIGYTAEWGEYNVEEMTMDLTVEPVYTPISYVATFKNRVDGSTLGTTTFTVEDEELSNIPALPVELGYTYAWESYTIIPDNITVYCDRTANLHSIKFFEDAEKTVQVGETQYFTCETESILEPEVPVHTGYDGSWPEYDLTADIDLEIVAVYELHKYYLEFRLDNVMVGDLVGYNITESYANIAKPEVPNKTGYNVSWPTEVELLYQELDNPQVIDAITSAKTYVVSYEGSTTTTNVTYDETYTLENPGTNYSWFYGEEEIPTTGVWKYDFNPTLEKRYSYTTIDFEDGEIPSVITPNERNTSTEVVAEDGTNNKVLRLGGLSQYGINFSKAHLDAIFSDPDVIAIEFDAKGTSATNDFRRKAGYLNANITYEYNSTGHGLTTEWKTFHYTREYYNNWVEGEIFLVVGAGTNVQYTYLDNFHPITEEVYGFENGLFNKKSPVKDSTYYTPGHGSYSVANPTAPDTKNRERYFSLLANDGLVTDVQWTAERASEGRYSLKVSKNSGYVAFYTFSNIKTLMGANGTFSFDVYSTIAARSDSEVRNFQDGMNDVTGQIHELGKWVTYTWTAENITDDGRFLILQGSTNGDWYFDNFRINYAA